MFQIAIPSYNRYDTIQKKTLATLQKYFIKAPIYIFTPQIEEYKFLENEKIKLVKCRVGLVNARQDIFKYFNHTDNILMIDDDIDNLEFNKIQSLTEIITQDFGNMKNNNCYLGSINASKNSFFKSNKIMYGSFFCVGSYTYLIINKAQPKDLLEGEDEMEDYERSLKYIKFYKKTYRNDNINIITRYEQNKGGMGTSSDRYTQKTIRSKALFLTFPNLCRLHTKKNYTGLIIKKNNNKILLLDKKDLKIDGGEMINGSITLDKNKNYFFYDASTKELLGYLLRSKLNIDNETVNFKVRNNNDNRGAIAGVVDKNKLNKWYKDNFDKLELNKQGTRTKKTSFSTFSVSNIFPSSSFNISNIDKEKNKNIADIYKIVSSNNFLDINYNEYIINKNVVSYCHKDKKNKSPYSTLIMLGKDEIPLIIPTYNLKIHMRNGRDILYFDLKTHHHCNYTHLKEVKRYSIVFYNK